MVHSGSRAMGQMITKHHLANTSTSSHGLAFIEAASERGAAYLSDVEWAERYAEQNRIAMVRTVAEFMKARFDVQADWSSLIHGSHNHLRRETHFGRPFWVHRKGAQSSQSSEAGIIPGSMATASFHVSGRGCLESLCSSSHGAGRKLSRKQACQTITTRQLHRQMQGVWFDYRLARSLRDESPLAYKDIHAVMRAQKSLTRIIRELRPLLSYKG